MEKLHKFKLSNGFNGFDLSQPNPDQLKYVAQCLETHPDVVRDFLNNKNFKEFSGKRNCL